LACLLVKDRFELWIVGKELFLSYKLTSKQRLTQAFISQNIDLPLVLSHSSHLLAKSALPSLSFHSRLIPTNMCRKKLTLLTESPGRAAMDQSDASSMASFFRSADPQRMIQIPTMYYFTL
jgi:hypothetical protein